MRALKSHSYVKIMNNNNGFVFHHKIYHIIQYSLLNVLVAWNLNIFNNGEVTGVLAWRPNDFYVMKNVCTVNLQLRKLTWIDDEYEMNQQIIRFCSVSCVFPG